MTNPFNETELLSETGFTELVAEELARYKQLEIATPQQLAVAISYGSNEPILTLKLDQAYEEYKKKPQDLRFIVLPFITEVGWTAHARRYAFADVSEHTLPLMRDLKHLPFTLPELNPNGIQAPSKGPLVYQELLDRSEEKIVMQLVLAKNELIQPLFMGDALRSYPDTAKLSALAVHNLLRHVLQTGLTLSEYRIENFAAVPWLVALRQGKLRTFLASLIVVPEVIKTIEKTLNAESGIMAIIPSREQLLVCTGNDATTAAQMGLLAKHLKARAEHPVSGFIWHFRDGSLCRIQTVEFEPDEVKEHRDQQLDSNMPEKLVHEERLHEKWCAQEVPGSAGDQQSESPTAPVADSGYQQNCSFTAASRVDPPHPRWGTRAGKPKRWTGGIRSNRTFRRRRCLRKGKSKWWQSHTKRDGF